jgi:glycolate oxidase FAD binding subunit
MADQAILRPNGTDELVEAVGQAAARGQRLEVRGGGTKSAIGRPGRDATLLQIQGFDTVIDYDGPELVLTAGASTPLAKIETLLAQNNQMLAFEPFDHGVLFGLAPAATLGGVIAAGVSGSRRLTAGAVRDHFLGLRGVSGRGEAFMGGAKVVKNVTGYDLPKLLANSWGQLAVMTEVTLKVLPRPQTVQTVVLSGLNERQACLVMGQALGSQADVAAAAHLPAEINGGLALTALRLEGFEPSVKARVQMMLAQFGATAPCDLLPAEASALLWEQVQSVKPLQGEGALWRINVPPMAGSEVIEQLKPYGARCLLDWAGGLVWALLPVDDGGQGVRDVASVLGGHAMLIRAPEALRRSIPTQHPLAPGVAALTQRVKDGFDPAAILDPERFL